MNAVRGTVLLTDKAWPDVAIEQEICAAAGLQLVEAPPSADEATLVRLATELDPVGILFCWAPVTASVLSAAPHLKVATRLGVGLDNIDLHEAARLRITVTRVPDYCVEEVSDHVLALTLAWARGLFAYDADVRAGRWNSNPHPLRRVRELTVGIWGFGAIGRRTAEKFGALGCEVLCDDRHPQAPTAAASAVPVPELLARADVLSLHLPAAASTTRIVDAGALAALRAGALLVNTSRGALVDLDALLAALDAGELGFAALDVLAGEPEVPRGLRDRDDVILTPHVAFNSAASVAELRTRASQDLVRVLQGEPPRDPVELPL